MGRVDVDLQVTGRFITLEGGEGVGKSTQMAALAQALKSRDIDVLTTREPGGSEGAEAIRRLLLEGDAGRWEARAEALLFAAARADHVQKTIRPGIDAGRWVLSDRFLDSSRAYQSGASGLDDAEILELHRIGSQGLLPDRTLVLMLPEGEASRRAALRDAEGADRIGARGADYHARVAQAFASYAEREPERVRLIDASGDADTVTARLIAAVSDLMS